MYAFQSLTNDEDFFTSSHLSLLVPLRQLLTLPILAVLATVGDTTDTVTDSRNSSLPCSYWPYGPLQLMAASATAHGIHSI